MKSTRNVSIALAVIAIVFWSTVATAFKIGLSYYSPFQLVFLASTCSAVVLVVLSLCYHRREVLSGIQTKKQLGLTLLQALLNPFLYYSVLFGGYDRLPAQIAQPLNFTWPIFLSIFAILFLKEKFSTKTFPALLLSFTGVLVVSLNGGFTGTENKTVVVGVILCLLSAIIWALYWIINMRDTRLPLVKLAWSFTLSVLFIWLYGKLMDETLIKIQWSHAVYPIYIGLFEMSITFWVWITALEKAKNTAFLSNLVYLIPVISLLIIRVVLKEDLQVSTLIGLLLILCGVITQSRTRR